MVGKPIISTTIQARSQLRQYDTEVVTRETVLDILTELGLSPDSELTRMVVNDNRGKSILARIFDGLSSAGFLLQYWSVEQFSHFLIFRYLKRSRGTTKTGTFYSRDNENHRCKI